MSAIVGLYRLDDHPVDGGAIERMLAALAHRGTDGCGTWWSGSIGLGQRLSWTTPESRHETSPIVRRDGALVLVADARLDNREELLDLVRGDGRPAAEVSDSELTLAAYEAWGDRCPERLLGDFAFAVWDRRARTLFCARDPFGVRSFYYHASERAFAFATEIKGLLCLADVPRRINEERVAVFLAGLDEEPTGTFYRDVSRLPPGHSIAVSGRRCRVAAFWAPDPTRTLRLDTDEAYAERFRALFLDSVRRRLRAVGPTGSTLSGGLDSSSVTCAGRAILRERGEPPLHTFSLVFDDVPACDERPYIEAVVAQGDLTPHFVRGDRVSPLTDFDRMLWHQDEPFPTPNLFMHWGMYGAARALGVRVMLEGHDGDTVVSHGTAYLAELARRGAWRRLAREVQGLARNLERSPRRLIWRWVVRPLLPWPALRLGRALRQLGRDGPSLNPLIDRAFARRAGLEEEVRAQARRHAAASRSARAEHLWRLTRGLLPTATETGTKAAAAFGIERRFPFFDRRVVEFCLSLPPEQQLHRGWSRMVLRRAMAGILPEEVRWRGGKQDFTPNFRHTLATYDRELVQEVVRAAPPGLETYVDLPAVRAAARALDARDTGGPHVLLWRVVSLGLWLGTKGPHPSNP